MRSGLRENLHSDPSCVRLGCGQARGMRETIPFASEEAVSIAYCLLPRSQAFLMVRRRHRLRQANDPIRYLRLQVNTRSAHVGLEEHLLRCTPRADARCTIDGMEGPSGVFRSGAPPRCRRNDTVPDARRVGLRPAPPGLSPGMAWASDGAWSGQSSTEERSASLKARAARASKQPLN